MSHCKTLLFVDDEKDVLEILIDLFSNESYDLLTATTVRDALSIINENSVDFVLSDLKLPDASGAELLKIVKNKNPETVRVLTSGFFDTDYGSVDESQGDGTLFMSKPWDLWTLKKLVTERLCFNA